MWKYIVKRLIMMIPIVIGISMLVFLIMSFSPGSAARMILGPEASTEDIQKLEQDLGLDKPLVVQYFDYMKNAAQGNLGKSYSTGDSVISTLLNRFPVTFKLSLASMIFAVIGGIPIGIISATKQYSIFDTITTIGALISYSLPPFVLGLLLIYIFSFILGWFPSFGIDTNLGYFLPAITLGVGTMSSIIRTARSTLLEVIRQDYIRTARGKGAEEKIVIFKHALINALIPVVTVAGNNFGYLLGGTVIIESVFSIPGMGTMLINAIRTNDTPIVMGGVMMLAIAFSFVNLIVDILYAYLDPRIKADYK